MSDGAAALERLRALTDDALAALDFGEAGDVTPLAEAMRYSLLAGGKRVRPVLCLATAEGFGCAASDALPTALAIELVHTFSLVHDDLPALDDDALRRGRPTAHVRYGEDIAVLAGDALLNHAFALVCDRQHGSDARRVAALRELTSAVGLLGMIGGQYRDVRPEAASTRAASSAPRASRRAPCSALPPPAEQSWPARRSTPSPRRAPSASSWACSSRSSTTSSTRRAATRPWANPPARTPAAAAAPSRASWASPAPAPEPPKASKQPEPSWQPSPQKPTRHSRRW